MQWLRTRVRVYFDTRMIKIPGYVTALMAFPFDLELPHRNEILEDDSLIGIHLGLIESHFIVTRILFNHLIIEWNIFLV